MKEQWKECPGFENYEVSDKGRIRNKKTKKILKQGGCNGYKNVRLFRDGKGYSVFVHRLVALAFITNDENKPQVNHLDKFRNNNCVNNLSWVTSSENLAHAREFLGGPQTKYKVRKRRKRTVLKTTPKGEVIAAYPSYYDAAKDNDLIPGQIYLAVRGRLTSLKGFLYRYG